MDWEASKGLGVWWFIEPSAVCFQISYYKMQQSILILLMSLFFFNFSILGGQTKFLIDTGLDFMVPNNSLMSSYLSTLWRVLHATGCILCQHHIFTLNVQSRNQTHSSCQPTRQVVPIAAVPLFASSQIFVQPQGTISHRQNWEATQNPEERERKFKRTCFKTIQEQTKMFDFHFCDISKLFWNLSKALEDVNTGRGKAMDLPSLSRVSYRQAMLF